MCSRYGAKDWVAWVENQEPGVRARPRSVSGEQGRYQTSRQGARWGHKLESATEFQEKVESNRLGQNTSISTGSGHKQKELMVTLQ